jgi:outer membrane protein assembly factor BamB
VTVRLEILDEKKNRDRAVQPDYFQAFDVPKIVRLLFGNPLIMKEMAKHVADAGSYAPVTVLVDERADDFSRAVADGVVYVSTYDGYVYALSASSGAKLWRNKVGIGGITSSAVANGVVYVSESNGNVYALSARTGDILWSNPTRAPI